MNANFLPADAVSVLVTWAKGHPVGALGATLFVMGVIYGFLQWRFKRQGSDLLLFSAVLTLFAFFVGSCLYLLKTKPGYRLLNNPDTLFARKHFRP
jgi:hypothetical protein